MNGDALVIGIGNDFRGDDGVGLAVAAALADHRTAGVRVITTAGDPTTVIDAWRGVGLVIVVDAALGDVAVSGRLRRWVPAEPAGPAEVSSHGLGLLQAYALGEALGNLPDRLVVFTVDIAEAALGIGLSPPVAAAVPRCVSAVLTEVRARPGRDRTETVDR
ncbi:hydrogenase maturation protease [Mycolicibacterium diernhoferi]|uniref:Peptidase M52 n=1 Tax=Mycolicibacterium diernhoferi TaxID=1801 RepID=A0A1Q4HER0_9MYCO|nr:hydrogenase maturation protease [Mycolicibacterium diernhoferi]OJZ66016.1 peptidase M52 [Mycolicibacterium diernhoferi]OPE55017.1 peptidase M52 [Mycolicibacterium diernhoferi]PEG54623.1 peptidase M52 [Mycolicibacterium diernhoferi]QYL23921.1 hydrogenase maturation protease [Mycolicibacterium diernhoferi]